MGFDRWARRAAPGLAAAAVLAAGAAHADGGGCQFVKVAELPVKFEGNAPLVPITVNDQPGWFLIDTGADSSMMYDSAANRFGLKQFNMTGHSIEFYAVGGVKTAKFTVVKDFGLSDNRVKDLRLYVVDDRPGSQESGLLGRDFLEHYDIEFDLANNTVRLWQAKGCGGKLLSYWTKDPGGADLWQDGPRAEFNVKVSIGGKAVKAILDSGATTSVMSPEVAALAGLHKRDLEATSEYVHGVGQKPVAYSIGTLPELTVGTEQIKNARLEVSELFSATTVMRTGSLLEQRVEGEPKMLLGADFLRSHRTLVALSQRTLYFTYSGGPVFQTPGARPTPSTDGAGTK